MGPDVRYGLLHGRLSSEEKAAALNAFASGDTNVLIATTVVEASLRCNLWPRAIVGMCHENISWRQHPSGFLLRILHIQRLCLGPAAFHHSIACVCRKVCIPAKREAMVLNKDLQPSTPGLLDMRCALSKVLDHTDSV